jgi:hypothetical protein
MVLCSIIFQNTLWFRLSIFRQCMRLVSKWAILYEYLSHFVCENNKEKVLFLNTNKFISNSIRYIIFYII